jgi:choline/ethanolamine kinase
LTCRELADPIISRIIARKLANVHCLDVPITKEPNWLFDNMNEWYDSFRTLDKHQLITTGRIQSKSHELIQPKHFNRPAAEFLLQFDFAREIEWLRRFLRSAESPVVFSHNDLQEGNILIPDYLSASKWHGQRSPNRSMSPPRPVDSNNNQNDADIALKRTQHYLKQLDKNMVLIDFEYCAYNYRGFDLANHFAEWTIDYVQEHFPYYAHQLDQYPAEEQQRMFIDEYLRHYLRENPEERDRPCNTTEHILTEVNYFNLATHLLWSIWSVKLALSSQIEFGYWVSRLLFALVFDLSSFPSSVGLHSFVESQRKMNNESIVSNRSYLLYHRLFVI